jgi:hypothetical protein
VDSLLATVVNFSETAVWVFGALFVADLGAVIIYVYRSGKVDEEEGRVVTERIPRSGNNRIGMGRGVFVTGASWAKKKVLVSRSAYVSDMSLVDGTATKSQRLFVHGIRLAWLLFCLAFVFGGLTLLRSDPAFALVSLFVMSGGLICGVTLIRKGRADALRKLKQRQASQEARQKDLRTDAGPGPRGPPMVARSWRSKWEA